MNEDLKSSSISKWIRPIIVIWLTIMFSYLILSNTETKESYITLLETIIVVAYGSYFIGRSSEKIMAQKNEYYQLKEERQDESEGEYHANNSTSNTEK